MRACVCLFSLYALLRQRARKGSEAARVTLKPAFILIPVGGLLVTVCVRGLKKGFAEAKPAPTLEACDLMEQDLNLPGRILLEHIGLVGFKACGYTYDSLGLIAKATALLKPRPSFDVSVFFLKDSKNIALNHVPQTSGSLMGAH